jgi:hypothetical protein
MTTTAPALSVADLKAMARNQDFRAAAARCLAHKAIAAGTRKRVNDYIRPIFERFAFTVSKEFGSRGLPEGALIPEERLLYLADLTSQKMRDYEAACHAAHVANGAVDLKPGYCPALMAENALIVAEAELIEVGSRCLSIDFTQLYGAGREDLLKLLLEIAVNTAR